MAQTTDIRITRAWYPLAWSADLKDKPLQSELYGEPIALFRDRKGVAGALVDRCPHRNIPLSEGSVDASGLRCRYHGWSFATDGRCTEIPGLCGAFDGAQRGATAYEVREQDGIIWTWATPGDTPLSEPPSFAPLGDAYTEVRRRVSAPASLHQVAENALDVPHTAFLHRGLFRSDEGRQEVEVIVRSERDRVEAQYIGEERPEGLVGRFLAPGGGEVEHFDRFILPATMQVEYRLGAHNHILIQAVGAPRRADLTELFAQVSFRTRLPDRLLSTVVLPFALRIFNQDVDVLRSQKRNVERFGGEAFQSTELDVLGGRMLRLMRAMQQGKIDDMEPEAERRLVLRL